MNEAPTVTERADGVRPGPRVAVGGGLGRRPGGDERVLDLCAAPGGKALGLAATGATVVAENRRRVPAQRRRICPFRLRRSLHFQIFRRCTGRPRNRDAARRSAAAPRTPAAYSWAAPAGGSRLLLRPAPGAGGRRVGCGGLSRAARAGSAAPPLWEAGRLPLRALGDTVGRALLADAPLHEPEEPARVGRLGRPAAPPRTRTHPEQTFGSFSTAIRGPGAPPPLHTTPNTGRRLCPPRGASRRRTSVGSGSEGEVNPRCQRRRAEDTTKDALEPAILIRTVLHEDVMGLSELSVCSRSEGAWLRRSSACATPRTGRRHRWRAPFA